MTTWQRRSCIGGGILILACAGMLGGVLLRNSSRDVEPLQTAEVVRTDLELTRVVTGDVTGKKETVLDCDLEDLPDPDGRIRDRGIMILEVIPEGTRVKKDDVLCRFDSQRYVEMARRQKIELERAISEEKQAILDRETSEVALRAYREGTSVQIVQQLDTQITLARADLKRARERLVWANRMRGLGYTSADEVASDTAAVQRLENSLALFETQLRNYRRYTIPKAIRELEVAVGNALRRTEFGKDQRESEEGRLKKLERLIEKCTMRAPHDGLVIYFDAVWRDPNEDQELRPGKRTYQGRPMFILPDLAHAIVEITLHEADLGSVRRGQLARVDIPALNYEALTGHVERVDPLPTEQWRAWTTFQGVHVTVSLDHPPTRLWPGLSARVAIVTGYRFGTLVVPSEAVAVEEGHAVCYVAGPDGAIERRIVALSPGDFGQVAIEEGLAEGERVVVNPARFRTRSESRLNRFPEPRPVRKAVPGEVVALRTPHNR